MTCAGCDQALTLRFTDLHGEAECIRCGLPYVRECVEGVWSDGVPLPDADFLRAFRSWWAERKVFTPLGVHFHTSPESWRTLEQFMAWMDRRASVAA